MEIAAGHEAKMFADVAILALACFQGEPTEPKLDVPNGVKAFGVKSEDEGE